MGHSRQMCRGATQALGPFESLPGDPSTQPVAESLLEKVLHFTGMGPTPLA